ncbi:aminotransferase class IV [Aurantimonas sp. VKM B-3413]|uniref:aminotransferase class IV n=1 Tax=Aurantimonas sp. VKM B-3413 TaxID=2779401 RepID=UPI001E290946|nr:aminotransferase class IV [Aurantimonas sp. VKM B-3413]MCB8838677.1 aminotransferase class IV [Aurantimonas sp. VKM B-3413]
MTDVWINGRFVEPDGAIAANDRGLLIADGVFDTALVLGGRVFRRDAHLDRLAAACETLAIPVSRSDLEAAMAALAERQEAGSIRLTVTRGPGPRGLTLPPQPRPTILGSSAPLAPAMIFAPLTLHPATIRRNETSPSARLKTLAYLDAVLANIEAKAAGADEALFLNTAGRPACTALGNFFVLRGDTLSTPPCADGVLDGITRGWILANAESFGLAVREEGLSPQELESGAILVTNSLRLTAPARLVRQETRPTPEPVRALMAGLCEAIEAECGVDPRSLGAVIGA